MNIVEGEIYRHAKRGSYYEMLGRAKIQIGETTVVPPVAEELEKISFVVYCSLADDTLWVRPESEFCDGRFEHFRGYVITNGAGRQRVYYKSGEGRGWKTRIEEATRYSDEDFAHRDLNALISRVERSTCLVQNVRSLIT